MFRFHRKTVLLCKEQSIVNINFCLGFVLGSKPHVWAKQEVNRPEFNLINDDIYGAGPRMLHIGLDKPEFNLTNLDIQGSKTQVCKFITTR